MGAVFKAIWAYIKRTDKLLITACVSLSALSCVCLFCMYKIGFIYGTRIPLTQLLATVLGLALAILISLFDYRDFIRLYKIYIPVSVVLMLLTFTPLAYKRAEANDTAWINLGITTFQPSEFLKIVFVLSFAYHLSKVQEDINTPKVLIRLLIHGGAAIGLVVLQKDFGTATVFVAVFIAMMFASGISWKYVLGAIGAAVPLLLIVWFFILDDYHKLRIYTVFNPELDPLGIGYQPMQGKISIGSGMFFGKGLLSSELRNIPEVYNDFMFAFIGEALGYFGATIVIIVLLVIVARIILTGMNSNDKEGYFICVGMFMIFAWQIIINIGMCVGLAPVIGITLPFLSAGGSSVVMLYMSIGVVLSVYNHNRKTVFG